MGVTAKVLENGEVLLPAEVGEAFGWKAGAELEVVRQGGDAVIRPRNEHLTDNVDELFSPITLEEFFSRIPKVTGPYPTDEEIDAIVLKEAARRFDEKTRR